MAEPEPEACHQAHTFTLPDQSGAVPTSAEARAKCCIAVLEEELEIIKQDRGTKQRKTTFYVAQGRAIRRMVVLYTNLEDLITENDHRYEEQESTREQDRLQYGYILFAQVLPWLHERLAELDINDCKDMRKKLKRGADAARGDDTSTLKDLVAAWLNEDFHPSQLLRSDDKQSRGFLHDDWGNNRVKVGIRERTSDYIVSENSWPLFLYEGYKINGDNLEQGLFMSKILVQAFKAVFTSPSSAKEADRDGNGADILENNWCAQRQLNQVKHMSFVSVSSWRTIDGDFDYKVFWNNVVDFFEDVPGPVAQRRVTKLLEWWTRKIFGKNHREDLTPEVVSQMSVTALAEQRKALEDAAFDSD
ncbi:hypothetical protein BD769DRAFT_1681782 [Suillus cothurnatus]|nr:hypothetical protein BD769DRAFT_1681782 [Suillus cothurnatus]